ncbi:hypothetical protein CTI12_AA466370 [Artemisia annua]|uniref:Uncharacterized protein n=1 Tax=Artemisia annua TaxID=35608 RepID=A0A2U1LQ66_ARTAN|nr:hypothetical protein CTI12_AA466370 [Artemisia annua]
MEDVEEWIVCMELKDRPMVKQHMSGKDALKWVEATYAWKSNHLEIEIETSSDEDDNLLFSSDDDNPFGGAHMDPYEDEPHILILAGVHKEG